MALHKSDVDKPMFDNEKFLLVNSNRNYYIYIFNRHQVHRRCQAGKIRRGQEVVLHIPGIPSNNSEILICVRLFKKHNKNYKPGDVV
jgi:hypothetical protein